MTAPDPRLDGIEGVLAAVPTEDRDRAVFALRTPDLYPAKNVADYLGVPIPAVHAWRKERGIKKAAS